MAGSPSDLRRGERNFNPANLRYNPAIKWQGLADPPQDDHGLCRFIDAPHGLRAGARDIYVKWLVHGLRTVRAIVSVYAPPNENDTDAYIAFVAGKLGVDPDQELNLGQHDQLQAFVTAVIDEEEGRDIYSDEMVAEAVTRALA